MAVLVALTGPTAFAEDVVAVPSSPTIASDKDDYPPGADVILTGDDWQPGETVHIRVNDDQGMTWRRDVDVIADGNGSVRDEFRLPDWFVAAYTVTATGPISGTATTNFTDANVTAATLSIRTAASATACTATSAASFTAGDRACARSTITSLSNNNPGQTGGLSVLWVNPSGTTVATTTHIGATGDSFDDTLVVNATGTWTVKACTNTSCPASALLASRTFTVNAATAVNTSTAASDATATFGDSSVTLSATVSPNTVNVGTVTFTVNGSTATSGTVTGGAATASFSLSGVDAGTYTIAATYSGGTGFNGSSSSAQSPAPTLTVDKAAATCVVDGYDVGYDATAHTATGTCTGVEDEDLSAGLDLSGTTHTAAGDYTDDPWSFTAPNTNYDDQNGTVDDNIDKAAATCVVDGYDVTYDAAAHTATGTCTGVEDEDLSAGLDLSGTTHTAAGDYTDDPWSFTAPNTNYDDQNGTVDDNIDKADAECSIFNYHVIYDGDPHTATGWCTGVEDEDLSADLDLSGTTHTAAGTYDGDPWSFTDSSGNYNDQDGTVDDLIDKADATCVVTGYDVGYDAAAHTATGTCTGVEDEDLSAGLDLSGTTHTDAGSYLADPWTFTAPNGNYNDITDGIVDDNIDKADATCVVTGYSVGYDAASHTATGTCTGVEDEDLSAGLDLSGTTHTDAGSYLADPWTFTAPNGNYNDDAGTVDDNIDKADATCVVTGYSVVHDGAAHTATGSCTGVLDEGLSGLDLSGTTHTAIGDYPADPWTFTAPNGNYNDDAGTVHDNIHYAPGGTCLGSPGHQILQPIDNDGSSVFKQGSTVPAKFRVCDAAGHSIGTPGVVSSFRLVQTTNGTVTVVDEAVVSTTPDTAFRWSSSDQQWIFNINTKNLSRNKTYFYRITLNDGSAIEFRFGLK